MCCVHFLRLEGHPVLRCFFAAGKSATTERRLRALFAREVPKHAPSFNRTTLSLGDAETAEGESFWSAQRTLRDFNGGTLG